MSRTQSYCTDCRGEDSGKRMSGAETVKTDIERPRLAHPVEAHKFRNCFEIIQNFLQSCIAGGPEGVLLRINIICDNFAVIRKRIKTPDQTIFIMIDYIKGKIVELNPSEMTVETYGIGYKILISLQSFSFFEGKDECMVYIHHYLREDEELFYGFGTREERELFRLLIGVSGIGAATARMMLSSLSSDEIRNAIIAEDLARIKSIKGIGLKSAQRLILELKDKVIKGSGGTDISGLVSKADNSLMEEASTALILLGFAKANVQKVLTSIIKDNPQIRLEDLIKAALKKL